MKTLQQSARGASHRLLHSQPAHGRPTARGADRCRRKAPPPIGIHSDRVPRRYHARETDGSAGLQAAFFRPDAESAGKRFARAGYRTHLRRPRASGLRGESPNDSPATARPRTANRRGAGRCHEEPWLLFRPRQRSRAAAVFVGIAGATVIHKHARDSSRYFRLSAATMAEELTVPPYR